MSGSSGNNVILGALAGAVVVLLVQGGLGGGLLEAQRAGARLAPSPQPPIGSIVAYGGAIGAPSPEGTWLECDGRPMSSGMYPELWARLGTIYGDGRNPDGTKAENMQFNLPNYQGAFLRGTDPQKRLDTAADARGPVQIGASTFGAGGTVVGSFQSDSFQTHGHVERPAGHSHGGSTGRDGAHTHNVQPPSLSLVTLHGQDKLSAGNYTLKPNEPLTRVSLSVGTENSAHQHGFETNKNSSDLVSVGPPTSVGTGNPVRAGGETRPANYAVKWLMRVR